MRKVPNVASPTSLTAKVFQMKTALSTAGLLLALAGIAWADEGDTSADPSSVSGPAAQAVNPVSVVSGTGVKVGEGSTLYPVLGVETGFVSNVYYEDSNPTSAGLLRILGQVGFGSLPEQRLDQATVPESTPLSPLPDHGDMSFRTDIYAAWDQFLSTNDNLQAQGGLSGGVVARGVINPNRPFSISFLDHLQRVTRPTNFESNQDTDREVNNLTIRLTYQPVGRTVGGYLYYKHNLDFFEDEDQRFADRLNHTFGLRVNWQWLPLTRLYAEASWGVFGGLGSESTKQSSYPLTTVIGATTVLSINTTLNARVGYANGFYSTGASYSTVTGGLQLGYRYSPLGRLLATYSYDQQDSINANFFTNHQLQLVVEHQFVPFVVFVKPEVHLRTYEGVSTVVPGIMPSSDSRSDLIFRLVAGLRYNFRDSIAATLEYSLTSDQTDFTYMFDGVTDDPSYTRHELLLGLKAAL